MKTHELKTWPEPFEALWWRRKTHEVRQDDRGFEVGDVLRLREWEPNDESYSGRMVRVEVTYISRGPDWGIPAGMVVMSIREVGRTVGGPTT